MLEFLYKRVLLITFCFLIFLGLYLLFGKRIKREGLKNYLRARILLGFAFIGFAIMDFIHWKLDLQDNDWSFSIASNLASYYMLALFLAASFVSLLDHRRISQKRIKFAILKSVIYAFYLSLIILMKNDFFIRIGLSVAALFFLIDIGYIVSLIFKIYRKALSVVDNYYSDNMTSDLHWFKNSIYFITIVGMTDPIVIFTNKYLITVHSVLMLFAFLYIFTSFLNYAVAYMFVDQALNYAVKDSRNKKDETYFVADDGRKIIDNRDKFQQIGEALTVWNNNKGFRTKSITIEQLTVEIGTNRTYLSSYINSTFSCSFREWITKLRIDDAKKIMLDDPTIKITKVSEAVGFLTDSHFVRQFSTRENISPAKWREREFSVSNSKKEY